MNILYSAVQEPYLGCLCCYTLRKYWLMQAVDSGALNTIMFHSIIVARTLTVPRASIVARALIVARVFDIELLRQKKQRNYFLCSEQGWPLSTYKNQRFPQCAFGPSWLWLGMSSCTKICQHPKRKLVSYKITISSLLIWKINTFGRLTL